jgi:hypothetical protein
MLRLNFHARFIACGELNRNAPIREKRETEINDTHSRVVLFY